MPVNREILVTSAERTILGSEPAPPISRSALPSPYRNAPHEQVQLAPQAVPERGVQEGGRERGTGRREPEPPRSRGVAQEPDDGEDRSDRLCELRRLQSLELRRRPDPRPKQRPAAEGE